MATILCVGNTTWDRFYSVDSVPSAPTKYFSTDYYELGGGIAATAAVTAARLGHHVSLISRVGNDNIGKLIVDELDEWGVDISNLRVIPDAISSNAVVHVDPQGERQITVHRDKRLSTDASWIHDSFLDNVDCVLCDCTWLEGAERLLSMARARSIPTVIDADLGGDALMKLLPLGDHVAFSSPALNKLTEQDGVRDVKEALLVAQRYVKGTVYVTQGEKGCYWLEGEKFCHLPAYRVNVVDTTGAGDVFHGALAVAVAEGKSGKDAVQFASAVAALKCTQPGGRAGIPNHNQLIEFIKNHP
ncbi:PfkB family carbohydrate kinase [Endozoicomonas atrinae]|uniref:PfkB family carbohydrate kinase n=1 Tax=Endozoicomonas atrinae TaxID=1333660 RepID=UPI0008265449|nr:PfkB family carbohydrate kinase [Endozoicomonas atrinae]